MQFRLPAPARSPTIYTTAAFCAVLVVLAAAGLDAQVAEVQVTPERVTLEAGKRQLIYAAAYDPQGNLVPADFSFSSSDSSIATVSADGSIVALAGGTARIEARAGGKAGVVAVTVRSPTPRIVVASLVLEPASLALLPLEPARIVARALQRDGSPVGAARMTWKSLDPSIAAVDRDGVVVGVAPGHTVIQATAAGVSASLPVSVDTAIFTTLDRRTLTPGATDTLRASVPSQGGRQLRTGLTWRSSDTAVVRVGPTGDVTAIGSGQAEVLVQGYGMTGRTRISVHRQVQSFTIIPRASGGAVHVPIGTTRRFEARAEAADSTPIPEAVPVWSISDTVIAGFAPETGVLTGRRAGTALLTARLEGFEPVVWTVQVVPTRVALDRTRLGLPVVGRAALAARLIDEAGVTVTGLEPEIAWASSRPEVATVSRGAIEAIAPGRTTLTATTPWGTSDTAEVYVTGDMLLSSNRANSRAFGIYQLRLTSPVAFVPLLLDSASSLHAVYSPDRTRVAFSSNRSGSFDIHVMDADGQNVTRLTSDPGSETEPAWTPDGRRIVHTASVNGMTQVASIGIDGADARVLTSAAGNQAPAVSPDGRTISFTSARDGNYEIYQMDIGGSNARRLTTTPQREQHPRAFPNGDLLYVVERPKGGAAIVRHGMGGLVTLVELPDPILSLALSADGTRLAYIAGRAAERGDGRIEYRLVVQRAEADPAPLTLRLGANEQPATPSF